MKKVLITAILGGIALLQVSAQKITFGRSDLLGPWVSKTCETFEVDKQPNFLKRDFKFSASKWQLKYTIFADPGCNVPLFTTKIAGPYTLGQTVNLNNTRKITWGQNAKFITAHVPDIQNVLNETGCGNTALPLNTERDISTTGCMALGIANVKDYPQEYDILKLENNQLFTGLRTEGMNLEQNRPTQIFEFPLVKP
jgi:Adenomatosis polyposis coli down-regulated 1